MFNSKITIKATAAIPRYGAVTSLGALADSGNAADETKIIGIAEGAMQAGFYYDVTITGYLFDPSWAWVPGGEIYLNGTVLSQLAPGVGFVKQLGWALSTQSILINVTP